MAESTTPRLTRIAFAFSDDARIDAAHVRAALAKQLQIVYEASAGGFDVQRALAERVEAVLVNVDGGEWMEAFEAKLAAANIRAVFNDPETSGQLEGADRARWLRHLVAKLRGSDNVDPPRPASAATPRVATSAPAQSAGEPQKPHKSAQADVRTPAPSATAGGSGGASLPPGEGARTQPVTPPPAPPPRKPQQVEVAAAPPSLAADDFGTLQVESGTEMPLDLQSLSALIDARLSGGEVPAQAAANTETDALSSMIDARLAEPARVPPPEPDTIWSGPPTTGRANFEQPASAGKAAPAMAPPARGKPAADKQAAEKTARNASRPTAADAPPMDQWALVDHDATLMHNPPPRPRKPVPPASPKPTAATDDLTLLPIDEQAPVATSATPVERWLDKSKGGSKKDGHRA